MNDPRPPSARLIAPRLSLASCARAYLLRNAFDCAPLAPPQRLNRFPASPLCSITWFIEGEAELAAPGLGLEIKVARAVFVGPQPRPWLSYNPGPVRTFSLMLYPAALHKLSGLDMSAWLGRHAPLEAALGEAWAALTAPLLAAPDDAARVALIEAFLAPRWQAARGEEALGGALGDWVRRLGVQVAAAGWGRGARNIERRVKAWAGQPMRTLRRMQRAERSFLETRAELLSGAVSWSDIAARSGYADQAHLSREIKEITGLTPTEFARTGLADESYWVYRVWA